jgi:hypothetical protein
VQGPSGLHPSNINSPRLSVLTELFQYTLQCVSLNLHDQVLVMQHCMAPCCVDHLTAQRGSSSASNSKGRTTNHRTGEGDAQVALTPPPLSRSGSFGVQTVPPWQIVAVMKQQHPTGQMGSLTPPPLLVFG